MIALLTAAFAVGFVAAFIPNRAYAWAWVLTTAVLLAWIWEAQ